MCAAQSLRKASSRLPLWGRWTRVSEDGEGEVSAAPSHGLCRSAGGLPSQSPSGDSSPEGRAKSRLPLWGALVPSGHRSALDRAGRREWTRVSEDGEGTPLACIPAFGKPPSRHSAVRERRFAVSLAFFYALCAYKVKVVGRCPTPCKLFEKSLTKNF